MKACAFYVVRRAYSPPGPCEQKQDLHHFTWGKKRVLACAPHRAAASAGRQMVLASQVALDRPRLVLLSSEGQRRGRTK